MVNKIQGKNSRNPLVSVIITTYNRQEYIVDTIQCVIRQTYKNIEIIVIDDGSNDRTYSLLRLYRDTGMIHYIYQQRSERSRARNNGFRHSKGVYIAFLDSDDLWEESKIAEQVAVLESKPDIGIVYTDVIIIDKEGEVSKENITWDKPKRAALYEDLMTNNVITGSISSCMIRRTCLEKVGLFDETMITWEDLDLWRRLAHYYLFYKINKPLTRFRMHGDNTQNKNSLMADGIEQILLKIAHQTPLQYQDYKTEAIARLLYRLAMLRVREKRFDKFIMYIFKSIWQQNQIVNFTLFSHGIKKKLWKYLFFFLCIIVVV
ncbi:MAG: glycosyltransferase family 2 protein [bacterium]